MLVLYCCRLNLIHTPPDNKDYQSMSEELVSLVDLDWFTKPLDSAKSPLKTM